MEEGQRLGVKWTPPNLSPLERRVRKADGIHQAGPPALPACADLPQLESHVADEAKNLTVSLEAALHANYIKRKNDT